MYIPWKTINQYTHNYYETNITHISQSHQIGTALPHGFRNMGGGNYCIAQETASLNFTKECGGKGTDDKGGAWTVTSDAKESQYDKDRGIHYGTSKKDPVSFIKVSTSAYAEAVITK